jgi:cellulose biosynthesis protein BcsQ
LINQFNENIRNKVRKGIAEKIRQSGLATFNTSIRQNSDLIKATTNARSVFAQNENSNGAKDYSNLVQEIINLS